MRKLRRRPRRIRPWLMLAAGCIVVLAIGGVWLANLQRPGSEPPVVSPTISREYAIQLNGAVTVSSAGTIVALADGLLRDGDFSVKLLRGSSDADAISAVVANDHVIGLASAAGFLKARAEGLPVVAFASSYAVSSVRFFALSNTRLVSPSDLQGMRVGYKASPELSTILQAFIARNNIAQSSLQIIESDTALPDLLNGKIDILLGHEDIEGLRLENARVEFRSLSPDSFGVHAAGPVYIANERAFANPRDLERFLIAIAKGWNAAYADYGRTVPLIAKSLDEPLSPPQVLKQMDAQRHFLRPFGTRFGELDFQRMRVLQAQLLQQRIIQQPADLARAVKYDVLTEVYRTESNTFNRIEP